MKLSGLFAALGLFGCGTGGFHGDGDSDIDADSDGDTDSDSDSDSDTGTLPWDLPGTPYAEPECELADLSDLQASYAPATYADTLLEVTRRRYTDGAFVLSEAYPPCDLDTFVDQSSWGSLLHPSANVAVHEFGHCWDLAHVGAAGWPYFLHEGDVRTAPDLANFFRSEIVATHEFPAQDSYLDVYLTGTSGDQDFNLVLEEATQYVHSLAVDYCLRDTLSGSTSARDGILTFFYYIERYLRIAREEHPDDYDEIARDDATIHVIDGIWGRGNFYLMLSETDDRLGINDDLVAGFVYADDHISELEAILP
jgi:hypothetical protein